MNDLTIEREAYKDGYKAGHRDSFLGIFSEYAWASQGDRNPYTAAYGRGYRDGVRSLPIEKERDANNKSD